MKVKDFTNISIFSSQKMPTEKLLIVAGILDFKT